ncbi:hypothetical protein D3C78_225940 [compost metagenome]
MKLYFHPPLGAQGGHRRGRYLLLAPGCRSVRCSGRPPAGRVDLVRVPGCRPARCPGWPPPGRVDLVRGPGQPTGSMPRVAIGGAGTCCWPRVADRFDVQGGHLWCRYLRRGPGPPSSVPRVAIGGPRGSKNSAHRGARFSDRFGVRRERAAGPGPPTGSMLRVTTGGAGGSGAGPGLPTGSMPRVATGGAGSCC